MYVKKVVKQILMCTLTYSHCLYWEAPCCFLLKKSYDNELMFPGRNWTDTYHIILNFDTTKGIYGQGEKTSSTDLIYPWSLQINCISYVSINRLKSYQVKNRFNPYTIRWLREERVHHFSPVKALWKIEKLNMIPWPLPVSPVSCVAVTFLLSRLK